MSLVVERKAAITANFLMMAAEGISGRVLDVGCGAKPYKPLFQDCEWVGLDARPVGDIVADMDDFSESGFACVICTDALQWSKEPAKAFRNMVAALKEGGTLLIVAPNCAAEDETQRWRFTFGCFAEMAQDNDLDIVYLGDGRGDNMVGQFDALGSDFRNTYDYASVLPAQFQGWLNWLDQTYPMLSCLVATK